jgi:hypothetical protein
MTRAETQRRRGREDRGMKKIKNFNHGGHRVHGERKRNLIKTPCYSMFSVVIISYSYLCASAPLREVNLELI